MCRICICMCVCMRMRMRVCACVNIIINNRVSRARGYSACITTDANIMLLRSVNCKRDRVFQLK